MSLESKSTVAPTSSVTQKSSNSTESPETDSTEKGDDEKPITEQIRTYIEDSVKSVKHAVRFFTFLAFNLIILISDFQNWKIRRRVV